MKSFETELKTAKKAALKAGKAIAKFYGTSLKVTLKDHEQPLTQADLSANAIIKKIIKETFPDDGWLSEEDTDSPERFNKERIWIVDPLDGTKDFIRQNPEFAVSVALSVAHKPVAGAVYNPITKELFWAVRGQGAFCNDKKIYVREGLIGDRPHLFVSHSEFKRGKWGRFEKHFHITPMGGTAYKMAVVARGDAHGNFSQSPKSEWDICAGHLLVEEAGGIVTRLDGSPILYNQKHTMLDGLIYCSSKEVHRIILSSMTER